MASSKNQTPEQNVCQSFFERLIHLFFASLSWNASVKPSRIPRGQKTPEARGTAFLLGKDGADPKSATATRWYLEASFQSADRFLPACVQAVAKMKHKASGDGIKGGKVPQSIVDEVQKKADELLCSADVADFQAKRDAERRHLESAAAYLLKVAAPLPDPKLVPVLATLEDGAVILLWLPKGDGETTAATVMSLLSSQRIVAVKIREPKPAKDAPKDAPIETPETPAETVAA